MPKEHLTRYEQNVYLKKNLRAALERDTSLELHYWVIRDWGRIWRFGTSGDVRANKRRFDAFRRQLDRGALTNDSFQTIASLSKVASFWNPEQYAIYDSRAVFSLNWLIYRFSEDKQLFPQPVGRNKVIGECNALLRPLYDQCTPAPWSRENAYHKYCELLRTLSKEIYNDPRPFFVEMLLFLAAKPKITGTIRTELKGLSTE